MKKINFHIVQKDKLEKKRGSKIEKFTEGITGPNPLDGNVDDDDVVTWDPVTMIWTTENGAGHFCNNFNNMMGNEKKDFNDYEVEE